MDGFEQIETDNKKIASDIMQLAGTEDSRLAVITAMFVRQNREMRLQNIQDVRQDISYGAKDFGILPEQYVTNMDSIVRSYIQEANRFMKAYNDEFINIQNILKSAEEKQKYYFFKIRETIVMKKICELAEKASEDYAQLDEQIALYRRKLGIYEKIIARGDKEFEDCKSRRAQDFKELFEMKKELALAVIQRKNVFVKFWNKLKNRFNRYKSFSRVVLQKHASKVNRMRTETIQEYVAKTRQSINAFDDEITEMLNA